MNCSFVPNELQFTPEKLFQNSGEVFLWLPNNKQPKGEDLDKCSVEVVAFRTALTIYSCDMSAAYTPHAV